MQVGGTRWNATGTMDMTMEEKMITFAMIQGNNVAGTMTMLVMVTVICGDDEDGGDGHDDHLSAADEMNKTMIVMLRTELATATFMVVNMALVVMMLMELTLRFESPLIHCIIANTPDNPAIVEAPQCRSGPEEINPCINLKLSGVLCDCKGHSGRCACLSCIDLYIVGKVNLLAPRQRSSC